MRKMLLPMFLAPLITVAQTLKFQGGMTVSTLNYKVARIKAYTKPYIGYNIGLGADYLFRGNFNLSSTFSSFSKGGRGQILYSNGTGTVNYYQNQTASLKFFSFNTCAEFNFLKLKPYSPFITIGPRADYFFSSEVFKSYENKDQKEKFVYGLLIGAGIKETKGRITGGVRAEYYYNSHNLDNINDNTFGLMAQFGYCLSKK